MATRVRHVTVTEAAEFLCRTDSYVLRLLDRGELFGCRHYASDEWAAVGTRSLIALRAYGDGRALVGDDLLRCTYPWDLS